LGWRDVRGAVILGLIALLACCRLVFLCLCCPLTQLAFSACSHARRLDVSSGAYFTLICSGIVTDFTAFAAARALLRIVIAEQAGIALPSQQSFVFAGSARFELGVGFLAHKIRTVIFGGDAHVVFMAVLVAAAGFSYAFKARLVASKSSSARESFFSFTFAGLVEDGFTFAGVGRAGGRSKYAKAVAVFFRSCAVRMT